MVGTEASHLLVESRNADQIQPKALGVAIRVEQWEVWTVC